jgi:hypothetical protein
VVEGRLERQTPGAASVLAPHSFAGIGHAPEAMLQRRCRRMITRDETKSISLRRAQASRARPGRGGPHAVGVDLAVGPIELALSTKEVMMMESDGLGWVILLWRILRG